MNIGIVGNGFVGGAVASFFKTKETVFVWDTDYNRMEDPWNTIRSCDIIFVCVPTPTINETTQDRRALYSVVSSIDLDRQEHGHAPIIVIKSTILPGTTVSLAEEFPELRFVMNPEFLTAKNAKEDFANPTNIVLGCGGFPSGDLGQTDKIPVRQVGALYEKHFPGVPLFYCTATTAELIKYTRNTFFATKVSFFNEIYALCDRLEISYDRVREGLLASTWSTSMHTQVPGPDGKLGYGGACFPKDSTAFVSFARDIGLELKVLEAAISTNKKVRKD